MIETKKRLRETIDTQSKLIHKKDEIIKKQLLDMQDYKEENADLREDNINYRQALRKILEESKKQQYGSVENLQAKIKELVKTAINN